MAINKLYLCDGKRCGELKINCGQCKHTLDVMHAKNGDFDYELIDGEFIVPYNIDVCMGSDGNVLLIEMEVKDECNEEHD